MTRRTTMNRTEACGDMLALASLHPSGALRPEDARRVEGHVEVCPECRDALALMERVHQARPAPPMGLRDEIVAALVAESEVRRTPLARRGWSALLAAAAVLALALSTGLLFQAADPFTGGWDDLASGDPFHEPADDWYVAGVPLLDGVSEETLLALMTDFE
ncbi:MAG: hypothetical protein EA352_04550 [Gemmatimonadales bacterium]|nr:MAG: hypothetical protein EA352_04550 [Gemmatimonadales bacterium]